jgi:hypothetical protein
LWGVIGILFIMIIFLNIYLSLVFSLTLEVFSMKVIIYLLVVIILFWTLITNINYKIKFYSKYHNWKEIWRLQWYCLDQFIFWNIFSFLSFANQIRNLKLFLVVNWWVIVIAIVVF